MEEIKERQSLHRFLQFGIYLSVLIELFLFFYAGKLMAQDYRDKYSPLVRSAEKKGSKPQEPDHLSVSRRAIDSMGG